MTREEAINNIKELQDTYITSRGEEDTVAVSLDGFDIEALDMAIKALEQEPKIKVLARDEATRKLGTVDIYKANAWITLLKDLEYLGMKICEVKE